MERSDITFTGLTRLFINVLVMQSELAVLIGNSFFIQTINK